MLPLIGFIVFCIGMFYLVYLHSKYESEPDRNIEKIINIRGAPESYNNVYTESEGRSFKSVFDK